jgi:hypothetical protein
MKTHIRILTLSIATYFGASASLFAAPFTFTNGDLILGFQATGGEGAATNVFFNLGSAISHRDNGNLGVLGNIASTLSAAYGSNWYSRTDLYFGAFGNLNFGQNSGIGGQGPVNGDPSRTVYVSQAAATPGQSLLWTGYTPNALGSSGNTFSGMEQMVVLLTTNPDNSANLNQTIQPLEWNSGWTTNNPTPGGAFGIFNGGIQQNFGKGGSGTHVDIQRILAYTTGAAPTGTVGTGTYETTISIGSDGSIRAQSAAAASSFNTWIGTFNPPLTNPADRGTAADPDNDGIGNLMEFVLNGNPSSSNTAILPALSAPGANFVFSFTRRADSASEVSQVFEYSTNLVDWITNTPVTIPNTPGTSGVVTVGASTGTAPNQVQAVTVTIPKGTNTKLFGRLKVVK